MEIVKNIKQEEVAAVYYGLPSVAFYIEKYNSSVPRNHGNSEIRKLTQRVNAASSFKVCTHSSLCIV